MQSYYFKFDFNNFDFAFSEYILFLIFKIKVYINVSISILVLFNIMCSIFPKVWSIHHIYRFCNPIIRNKLKFSKCNK